ncbi:MAG TPA: penicillin-binding protein [Bacteroidales bacterium]|nr:penicillin-binding protein [Bacteroidales bacterium]HOV54817.1 penicillin-binding protein [Bacteroidales bacterium]HPM39385.1 penicillin-binding protein [Bacteroidales bacterium]HPX44997.1 penicillin-binding protein [Bacteroidales bacterium]
MPTDKIQFDDKAKSTIFGRASVVFFCILVIGILIIYKIIDIQYVRGDELRSHTFDYEYKYVDIIGIRGNIYSEDGMVLATSIPVYDVYLDLNEKNVSKDLFDKKIDSLSLKLANKFKDKTAKDYKNLLIRIRKSGKRYVKLMTNISYEDAEELKTFPIFKLGQYGGGLILVKKDRRVKPLGSIAERTIGFSRENFKVGIEGAYDSVLTGKKGYQWMHRIAPGVWIPTEDSSSMIKPVDGKHIKTTINAYYQQIATQALTKVLQENAADHGTVLLMEVSTGEIKAIANLKRMPDSSYQEVYNYAVGERYEPGSTFKTISLLAAIDDGLVNLDEVINTGNGIWSYGSQVMSDSHEGGFGEITLRKCFELSSNIGISKAIVKAYGSNEKRFFEKLESFGITHKTGIDLSGEPNPAINSPTSKYYSKYSLAWTSIGYEVLLTPLQILTFYNAIANHGKMMQPYIVEEFIDENKTVWKREPTVINKKIASDNAINTMRSLLEGVVQQGTASNIKDSIIPIAGKTGTALIAQDGGYRSEGKQYVASFAGYFPANNPLYSCIVVVHKPKQGLYYGSQIAAPVFHEIAKKIYATQLEIHSIENKETYYNILPFYAPAKLINNLQSKIKITTYPFYSNNGYAKLDSNKVNVLSPSYFYNQKNLPDFRGMLLHDALIILKNLNLKVEIVGAGRVYDQLPAPQYNVQNIEKVVLYLK